MNHLPNANDVTMVADKHNNLAVVYDSVQALARFAKARYNDPDGLIRQWSGRMPDGKPLALSVNEDAHNSGLTNPSSPAWDLNTNFYDTLDMAKSGWLDGVKELKKDSLASLQHSEETRRSGFKNDVSGAFPVIGAFLSGRPDCMRRYQKITQEDPIINLLIPVGFAANVNSRDPLRHGRSILRLINNLETDGFQVGIYIGEEHHNMENSDKSRLWHLVSLKKPNTEMSLSDLAFALAHPSFFRRLLFSSSETFRHGLDVGYGYAENIRLDSDHPLQNILPNSVVLPHYYRKQAYARRTEDQFYKEALTAVEHYVKKSG